MNAARDRLPPHRETRETSHDRRARSLARIYLDVRWYGTRALSLAALRPPAEQSGGGGGGGGGQRGGGGGGGGGDGGVDGAFVAAAVALASGREPAAAHVQAQLANRVFFQKLTTGETLWLEVA